MDNLDQERFPSCERQNLNSSKMLKGAGGRTQASSDQVVQAEAARKRRCYHDPILDNFLADFPPNDDLAPPFSLDVESIASLAILSLR